MLQRNNRVRALAPAALLGLVCIGLTGGTPQWYKHHDGAFNQSQPAEKKTTQSNNNTPAPQQTQEPAQISADLAKKVEKATALVVTSKTASASAVCINPAGLFITAREVVDTAHAKSGDTLDIVVNCGESNQRKVTTKVIRMTEQVALLFAQDTDHGATPFTHLELGAGSGLNGRWNVTACGVASTAVTGDAKVPAPATAGSVCWFAYLPNKGPLKNIHLDTAMPAADLGGPVVGNGHAHLLGILHKNEKGELKFGVPVNTIYLVAETPVIAVRIGPATGSTRSFTAAVMTALGKLKDPHVTLAIGTGKDAVKVPMTEAAPGVYTASTAADPQAKYTVSVNDGTTSVGETQGKVDPAATTAP